MIVIWSPLAIGRVAEIAAWIAEDRPGAADDLVDGIYKAVQRLSEFPLIGREVPESGRPEIHEIIYRKYRIVYRTTRDRVEILTVRHSLQLLDENDVDENPAA